MPIISSTAAMNNYDVVAHRDWDLFPLSVSVGAHLTLFVLLRSAPPLSMFIDGRMAISGTMVRRSFPQIRKWFWSLLYGRNTCQN